jgi:hypothetical protein
MPALLTLFVQARAQGAYDRLLKRLAKISLLIVDDFALSSLSDSQKQDFLEAIEERYGSGALTITSELPVTDWHEYLGGGRVADAILDGIVHDSHRIEISSKDSMRKPRPGLPHAKRLPRNGLAEIIEVLKAGAPLCGPQGAHDVRHALLDAQAPLGPPISV